MTVIMYPFVIPQRDAYVTIWIQIRRIHASCDILLPLLRNFRC